MEKVANAEVVVLKIADANENRFLNVLDKKYQDKLLDLAQRLNKELNLLYLNSESSSVLKKIEEKKWSDNLKNDISEVNTFLGGGNFFNNVAKAVQFVGYRLGTTDDPKIEQQKVVRKYINLLDKIYSNYEEINKAYNSVKNVNTKSNEGLSSNKTILETICGDSSKIKEAKKAYEEVSKIIEDAKKSVKIEKAGDDTVISYLDKVQNSLNDVVSKLKAQLEEKDTKFKSTFKCQINDEYKKYMEKYKELQSLSDLILLWCSNINSNAIDVKFDSNTDTEKLAETICKSTDIYSTLNGINSEYKDNLISLFEKFEKNQIETIKKQLSLEYKKFKEGENQRIKIKNALESHIKAAKNFLENPSSKEHVNDYVDNLTKDLKNIKKYVKTNNNTDEKWFYPKGYDENKVIQLTLLLDKYKVVNDNFLKIEDAVNFCEVLSSSDNIINNADTTKDDYTNKFYEYCTKLVKEKVYAYLESGSSKNSKELNNKKINYVKLLTSLNTLKNTLPKQNKGLLDDIIKNVQKQRNKALDVLLRSEFVGNLKKSTKDNKENKENFNEFSGIITKENLDYISNRILGPVACIKEDLCNNAYYLLQNFTLLDMASDDLDGLKQTLGMEKEDSNGVLDGKLGEASKLIENGLDKLAKGEKSSSNIHEDSDIIFRELFDCYANNLRQNNKSQKGAEKNTEHYSLNNIKRLFNKFYKNSEIDVFLQKNKDFATVLENVIDRGNKNRENDTRNFTKKYNATIMPQAIKDAIAGYFEKENIRLLQLYANANDDFVANREYTVDIFVNTLAIEGLSSNKKFNGFSRKVVSILKTAKVLNNSSAPNSNDIAQLCNGTLNAAFNYHQLADSQVNNMTTYQLLESVCIKLLCEFVKKYRTNLSDYIKTDIFADFVSTYHNDSEKFDALKSQLSKENCNKLLQAIPDLDPNYKSNMQTIKTGFSRLVGSSVKFNLISMFGKPNALGIAK